MVFCLSSTVLIELRPNKFWQFKYFCDCNIVVATIALLYFAVASKSGKLINRTGSSTGALNPIVVSLTL